MHTTLYDIDEEYSTMSETKRDVVDGTTEASEAGYIEVERDKASLYGERTTNSIPIPDENTWSEDTNVVSANDGEPGDVQERKSRG